ncbi:MAG: Peptidyl-tRNA hydrolase [uncultured Nocardioidaceae bacterium]|uniref:Peptidyl-tRNA hydrolase n=1 Tax=uncultured Nocardioidaceae bacterium TaxID=253824 RepID=A0A6J4LJC6_9ACTN|nr:MAG: Peptidyl-tRNA hydrolase [uncultured Nocardioidaceae bacterium]
MTSADRPEVWVVVGLGNPGPTYAGTRHNVGYAVVDELVSRVGGRLRAHRSGRADVLEGRTQVGGPRVVLGRGRTYMNESGGPVASLLAFYKVPAERLVVVHDELDLPFGALRLKLGGGDNGHNGLRSVRGALGTGEFHRVRVGVGRPPGRQSAADHVLAGYSAAERRDLPEQVVRAADAVEVLVEQGLETAQQRFNGG